MLVNKRNRLQKFQTSNSVIGYIWPIMVKKKRSLLAIESKLSNCRWLSDKATMEQPQLSVISSKSWDAKPKPILLQHHDVREFNGLGTWDRETLRHASQGKPSTGEAIRSWSTRGSWCPALAASKLRHFQPPSIKAVQTTPPDRTRREARGFVGEAGVVSVQTEQVSGEEQVEAGGDWLPESKDFWIFYVS